VTPDPDPTRIIHTIRAKSEGERISHQHTRFAFLRHVQRDSRTRDLFERWGHATGLDQAIAGYVTALDFAAMATDLPHRSALHREDRALRQLPTETLDALMNMEGRCDTLLATTRDARAAEAIAFVRSDLFVDDPETPMSAWLADDLMNIFDAEVLGQTWGEMTRLEVPRSPVRGKVPKGQRPKGQGEHLERNAGWFYRACVAQTRATPEQLALEWVESQRAKGVNLEPRDEAGIGDRPDTKLIRHGIDDARRLLELSIPPQEWLRFWNR
jgi:hypothetical protein